MDLPAIRSQIDRLDRQLLRLLHERMEYGLRAGKQKESVRDAAREERLLQGLLTGAPGLLAQEFVTRLYRTIFEESKRLQEMELRLVGFQGAHGAWGEIAIRTLAGAAVPIPCREFADVFSGVARGKLDLGMVPVENSLEGAVTEVNDMLVETELKITAEVVIPISQCLLALPGSDHREIRVVYSHPQALAQCRAFLSRNKLEPRPFYDTAGAARWLAAEKPGPAAVIASKLAAVTYGLEVIKENIADNPENSTRFVLLAREENPEPGQKCSLVFSTRHRAGALLEILRIFAAKGINLTRIESRPSRRNPGVYAFLLDFLGGRNDPAVVAALQETGQTAISCRNLGFYQDARP